MRAHSVILPRAQHIVSYHIVLQGSGYASLPGMQPTRFAAGDVLVFPHGDSYEMLSQISSPPEFTAEGTMEFFREMAAGRLPFVIKEGGGGPERAQFVCGFLGCDTRPFNPLLCTLPQLLLVQRAGNVQNDLLDRLIDLTLAEARTGRAGSECIRLGLSELIFVEVLRRISQRSRRTKQAGFPDCAIQQLAAHLHCCTSVPFTRGLSKTLRKKPECRAQSWRTALRISSDVRQCNT